MTPRRVTLERDAIRVGGRFSVSLQRTLRVPEQGGPYPLPPGLGRLPILPVTTLGDRIPPPWRRPRAFFAPLYQREALWLAFGGASWKPNALQVGVGGVDAVAGGHWDAGLTTSPQNYVVCPLQPWLDGINAGAGLVRQFVAVPLGSGLSVEARLTGRDEVGGIQLRVFEPVAGRFPNRAPPRPPVPVGLRSAGAMGLGAGGRIEQRIYPDPHGVGTWDRESATDVHVFLVNSEQYRELAGLPPPPTPVTAATYAEHGLPWFRLYDETLGDVEAPAALAEVAPVGSDEAAVTIDPDDVRDLLPPE